jgi:alkanesulfonate monooxygenase SsuD/methylene tetrahydromethanopterin reductase-like flavin-dependent oxidoreductase (luciferase family)
VFDHLWPIGAPGRPALACLPALAAVATMTSNVCVGTLVARVGLHDDERIVDSLATIATAVDPARMIVGLGAGDRLSAAENRAYGLAFPPVAQRVAALIRVADAVHDLGLVVWVGGRSAVVREAAAGHADAANLWGATPGDLAVEAAELRAMAGDRPFSVTWGGQVLVGRDADDAARLSARYGPRPGLVAGAVDEVVAGLRARHDAAGGLTWAVCGPLDWGAAPEPVIENLGRVARALALA